MDIRSYFSIEPKTAAIQKPLSYCRVKKVDAMGMIDELIETGSEITITFREKFRDVLEDEEIGDFLAEYIRLNFEYWKIEYILLIPEYGENNHLHYHGLVKGTHKQLSKMMKCMKYRMGRTTIRTVRYVESYKKYLMKEYNDIKMEDKMEIIYIQKGEVTYI